MANGYGGCLGLVVPVILSFLCLTVFVLPNLQTVCGNKPEGEGVNGIGALNRAQTAYHFEKQAFADSIEPTNANDLGIILHSDYFSFSTQATDNAAFSYAIPKETYSYLESYVGAVFYLDEHLGGRYELIRCKGSSLELEKLSKPIIQDGQLSCGEGMEKLD